MRYGGAAARAFTLVELLVVVAILALLLTMLMPTLGRAKELSRAVLCRTKMQAIGRGVVLYGEDFDGALHWRHKVHGEELNHVWYWADALAPYADPTAMSPKIPGSVSVGVQPASGQYSRGWVVYSKLWDCPSQENRNHYEYCMNYLYSYFMRGQEYTPRLRYLSEFTAPSRLCHFMDTGAPDSGPEVDWVERGFNPARIVATTALAYYAPHLETSNVWWFDGHVSPLTSEEIFAYKWPQYWPFRQYD